MFDNAWLTLVLIVLNTIFIFFSIAAGAYTYYADQDKKTVAELRRKLEAAVNDVEETKKDIMRKAEEDYYVDLLRKKLENPPTE